MRKHLDIKTVFYKNFIIYSLFFLLHLPLLKAQIPHVETGFPSITNYSVDDYKGHARNWAVLEDEKGIMYFGNNFGILEFDGIHWELIDLGSSNFTRALTIDENRRIYVGGFGNFGYLQTDEYGKKHFVSLMDYVDEFLRKFNDI